MTLNQITTHASDAVMNTPITGDGATAAVWIAVILFAAVAGLLRII